MAQARKPVFQPHPIEQDYDIKGALGRGAFAEVNLGVCKTTGVNVAIKTVKRKGLSAKNETYFNSEALLLQELDHHNIVKSTGLYQDPSHFYMVLEYVDGGELFERVVQKTFYAESDARDAVRTIISAIDYCHKHDVVHRDLKPENLLLKSKDDDTHLKVADFGLAVKDNSNGITGLAGSPLYMAPEVISKVKYGKACDMWSCGVIAYVLLGGYPPFSDNDQQQLFKKILSGRFEFHAEYWSEVSSKAKDFIERLLTKDPLKRMTSTEALSHPWIHEDQAILNNDLSKSLDGLKSFNSARKLKRGMLAVLAVQRISSKHLNVATASDEGAVASTEDVVLSENGDSGQPSPPALPIASIPPPIPAPVQAPAPTPHAPESLTSTTTSTPAVVPATRGCGCTIS